MKNKKNRIRIINSLLGAGLGVSAVTTPIVLSVRDKEVDNSFITPEILEHYEFLPGYERDVSNHSNTQYNVNTGTNTVTNSLQSSFYPDASFVKERISAYFSDSNNLKDPSFVKMNENDIESNVKVSGFEFADYSDFTLLRSKTNPQEILVSIPRIKIHTEYVYNNADNPQYNGEVLTKDKYVYNNSDNPIFVNFLVHESGPATPILEEGKMYTLDKILFSNTFNTDVLVQEEQRMNYRHWAPQWDIDWKMDNQQTTISLSPYGSGYSALGDGDNINESQQDTAFPSPAATVTKGLSEENRYYGLSENEVNLTSYYKSNIEKKYWGSGAAKPHDPDFRFGFQGRVDVLFSKLDQSNDPSPGWYPGWSDNWDQTIFESHTAATYDISHNFLKKLRTSDSFIDNSILYRVHSNMVRGMTQYTDYVQAWHSSWGGFYDHNYTKIKMLPRNELISGLAGMEDNSYLYTGMKLEFSNDFWLKKVSAFLGADIETEDLSNVKISEYEASWLE